MCQRPHSTAEHYPYIGPKKASCMVCVRTFCQDGPADGGLVGFELACICVAWRAIQNQGLEEERSGMKEAATLNQTNSITHIAVTPTPTSIAIAIPIPSSHTCAAQTPPQRTLVGLLEVLHHLRQLRHLCYTQS